MVLDIALGIVLAVIILWLLANFLPLAASILGAILRGIGDLVLGCFSVEPMEFRLLGSSKAHVLPIKPLHITLAVLAMLLLGTMLIAVTLSST
jgi:hypothetical protein